MLPDGYTLKLIRKYNQRLLNWIPLLLVLSVIPAFHQNGKPAEIANWDYLAISVLLMTAFTNLVKFLIRNSKPVLHPLFKFLGRNGDPEELARSIDGDALKAGASTESSILVTGSCIMHQGFFRLEAIPLSAVVWSYRKTSGLKPNEKGQTSLAVFTIDGKAHLMKYKHIGQGNNPAADIARLAPWAFAGYSEKTALRWKTNRKAMIDSVLAKLGDQ